MSIQQVLFILSIIFFVLAAVFIGLAAFVFFARNVRDVQADLSGKKRAAAVEEITNSSRTRRDRRKGVARVEPNVAPVGVKPVEIGKASHGAIGGSKDNKTVSEAPSAVVRRDIAASLQDSVPQDDTSETSILSDDDSSTSILSSQVTEKPPINHPQISSTGQDIRTGEDTYISEFEIVRKIVLTESKEIIKVGEQGDIHE